MTVKQDAICSLHGRTGCFHEFENMKKKKKKLGREWVLWQDMFSKYFGRPVFGHQVCKCGFIASTIMQAKRHLKAKEDDGGHWLRIRNKPKEPEFEQALIA